MHFQAQPTMQADMLDLGTHCNDQHAQPTDLPDLGMHCNDRHAQPTDQPTDRPTCQATSKTYAAKIPATNPARLKTGLDRKRSSMEMVQAFLVLSGPETGADPDRASYGTRLQKLYHPAWQTVYQLHFRATAKRLTYQLHSRAIAKRLAYTTLSPDMSPATCGN